MQQAGRIVTMAVSQQVFRADESNHVLACFACMRMSSFPCKNQIVCRAGKSIIQMLLRNQITAGCLQLSRLQLFFVPAVGLVCADCSADEYRCVTMFACIPASSSCDGMPNCDIGEDENCSGKLSKHTVLSGRRVFFVCGRCWRECRCQWTQVDLWRKEDCA